MMFIEAILSGLASLIFQPVQALAAILVGPFLAILMYPWPIFLLIAWLTPPE